jgi:hypothetical protein
MWCSALACGHGTLAPPPGHVHCSVRLWTHRSAGARACTRAELSPAVAAAGHGAASSPPAPPAAAASAAAAGSGARQPLVPAWPRALRAGPCMRLVRSEPRRESRTSPAAEFWRPGGRARQQRRSLSGAV